MKNDYNVRTPQITDLKTAIRLFYERPELSNSDITELFGKHSPATISRLKSKVRQRMIEEGTPVLERAVCQHQNCLSDVWT